ncbi:MAG TPA: TrmH family RNA methyltransferase [Bacillota bacterium]
MPTDLTARFQEARRDRALAVLEGFHAVKHALRFGAEVDLIVSRDPVQLRRLAGDLAPDIEEPLLAQVVPVDPDVFARLSPTPPETGVLAIARRRLVAAAELLAAPRQAPLVFLERPTHLGNVGAVIRVAAAAGAAGVVTTGPHDPWHPSAIRGAAGLHYALPVARVDTVDGAEILLAAPGNRAGAPGSRAGTLGSRAGMPGSRAGAPSGGEVVAPPTIHGPLLALHPEGEPLLPGAVPSGAVLAFGSERRGLSAELLARADRRVGIPMAAGVSSLNLATAVAVVLYTWRLTAGAGPAGSTAGPPAGR